MEPNKNTIRKYINHTTSEKEEKEILEWLEEKEDNPRYFAEKMSNISVHDTFLRKDADQQSDRMLARLNARIDSEIEYKESNRRIIGRVLGFFCAAVFLLGVFFLWHPDSSKPESRVETLRYSQVNGTNKTLSFVLPDRTKVFLSPGSALNYDVSDLDDRRVISLDGEAYFDVAKDSLRPLFVKTRNIAIKVLGTAFSVRSSSEFPNTEVVLERGLVRILSEEGTNLVNLFPDQKAVFNEGESIVMVKDTRAKAYIAEHFNLVRLEQVSFADIKRELENHYGVNISVRGTPDKNARYVFQYLNTDSIEDVLTVLEFISGVRCEIK